MPRGGGGPDTVFFCVATEDVVISSMPREPAEAPGIYRNETNQWQPIVSASVPGGQLQGTVAGLHKERWSPEGVDILSSPGHGGAERPGPTS